MLVYHHKLLKYILYAPYVSDVHPLQYAFIYTCIYISLIYKIYTHKNDILW